MQVGGGGGTGVWPMAARGTVVHTRQLHAQDAAKETALRTRWCATGPSMQMPVMNELPVMWAA